MEVSITGSVYVAKGGAVRFTGTEEDLDAFIRKAFRDGAMLTMTLNLQAAGSTEFCDAPSKWYGTCDHPLFDAPCHHSDNHETEETKAAKEEARLRRAVATDPGK